MDISGKIIKILPEQTGQGKNGVWKKQDFVIEIGGKFPKQVCISMWGDKAAAGVLTIGNNVNVSFDVESREFNGKYYTDLKAWKVTPEGANAHTPGQNERRDNPPPPPEEPPMMDDDGVMPF